MNTLDLIYQEARDLPEAEAREVLDFMTFLKTKRQRATASAREPGQDVDMSEFDQFGAVYDGHFDRETCYDRPGIR